ELLYNLCVGGNRVFNISNLSADDQEQFYLIFKNTVQNYTGFQRIMSILTIWILNNCDQETILPSNSVDIIVEDGQKRNTSSFRGGSEDIVLIRDKFVVGAHTFEHEISHLFHSILFTRAFYCAYRNVFQLFTRSVFDSEIAVDFKEIFFPALNKRHMEEVVNEKAIIERSGAWEVKKDIKNALIKNIIDYGLLDFVFNYDMYEKAVNNFKMNHQDQEKKVTEKKVTEIVMERKPALVKAIYAIASIFNVSISENGILKLNPIWTNSEEILTIIGLLPFKIGDVCIVLQDKQNELIFKKRQLEQEVILDENANPGYRFHSQSEKGNRVKEDMLLFLENVHLFPTHYPNFNCYKVEEYPSYSLHKDIDYETKDIERTEKEKLEQKIQVCINKINEECMEQINGNNASLKEQLNKAIEYGEIDIIKAINDKLSNITDDELYQSIEKEMNKVIVTAARKGQLDVIKHFIETEPYNTNDELLMALEEAVNTTNVKIVSCLLDAITDVQEDDYKKIYRKAFSSCKFNIAQMLSRKLAPKIEKADDIEEADDIEGADNIEDEVCEEIFISTLKKLNSESATTENIDPIATMKAEPAISPEPAASSESVATMDAEPATSPEPATSSESVATMDAEPATSPEPAISPEPATSPEPAIDNSKEKIVIIKKKAKLYTENEKRKKFLKMARYIIDKKPSLVNIHLQQIFIEASCDGDLQLLKKLYKLCDDSGAPKITNETLKSALGKAVFYGQAKATKLLYELITTPVEKAKLNAPEAPDFLQQESSENGLCNSQAVDEANAIIIKELENIIKKSDTVETMREKQYNTKIFASIMKYVIDTVKIANAIVDDFWEKAFLLACTNGNYEVVEYVFFNKSSIITDDIYENALGKAEKGNTEGHVKIVKEIIQNLSTLGKEEIVERVVLKRKRHGKLSVLSSILSAKFDGKEQSASEKIQAMIEEKLLAYISNKHS
ncbi:MAG: procyclic acidic repetitive family protein, partial [Christensenellaceae bacterium]|nr:procyclic acidic repetitive family protein [Christensenellaceae bacterium]